MNTALASSQVMEIASFIVDVLSLLPVALLAFRWWRRRRTPKPAPAGSGTAQVTPGDA